MSKFCVVWLKDDQMSLWLFLHYIFSKLLKLIINENIIQYRGNAFNNPPVFFKSSSGEGVHRSQFSFLQSKFCSVFLYKKTREFLSISKQKISTSLGKYILIRHLLYTGSNKYSVAVKPRKKIVHQVYISWLLLQ